LILWAFWRKWCRVQEMFKKMVWKGWECRIFQFRLCGVFGKYTMQRALKETQGHAHAVDILGEKNIPAAISHY